MKIGVPHNALFYQECYDTTQPCGLLPRTFFTDARRARRPGLNALAGRPGHDVVEPASHVLILRGDPFSLPSGCSIIYCQ